MIKMNKLGRRLAHLRQAANLRQADVAIRCGVSAQAVSKWERGYACPDILILDDIAAALGVEINDLFLFDSENEVT